MPLFQEWCACEVEQDGRKRLLRFAERDGGRAAVVAQLPRLMRSHYDETARIAGDIEALGYAGAAAVLAERMPRSARARSGELGEILATELVEEQLGFEVPVRRLRYKDGREMALRGDDFIGMRTDADEELHLLKGEAKSRANLTAATIAEARAALSRDDGRPTATSLLFIADRLMDRDGAPGALGRKIRNEVALRSVTAARINHALFTMSGNGPPRALATDLGAASLDRNHVVVHLHIADHQEFIRTAYEGALVLGDN
ncbi:Hachiman antiphage defense system protein HamA [Paraburkholderia saeva]|uniref:Hachiman antiphage defense system protein HamA n=1 Tax=Paraburkholderia saeva TaxID=2777537 RepID=UPI001D6CF028|nr:Hachiman antiphage defense system protein HamA [Paraburkholderia saeva]CAG4911221.1 hypothetical protein R70241_03911 [Paraburkholderia saeva]